MPKHTKEHIDAAMQIVEEIERISDLCSLAAGLLNESLEVQKLERLDKLNEASDVVSDIAVCLDSLQDAIDPC